MERYTQSRSRATPDGEEEDSGLESGQSQSNTESISDTNTMVEKDDGEEGDWYEDDDRDYSL